MATYQNGRIPEDLMVSLGSGVDKYGPWKWLLPPGTAAKWRNLLTLCKTRYGVTLRITPGWNCYRPLRIQVLYRADLGIHAAVPGTSSHGGSYGGADSMAIDVQNWKDLAPGDNALAWSRFSTLCKEAGFVVNFVTPQELWHIGDFNPWYMPADSGGATPLPEPQPDEAEIEEEEEMKGAFYKNSAGVPVYIWFNEVSGFYTEWTGRNPHDNNTIAGVWKTGAWVELTASVANVLKVNLEKVRTGSA